MKLFLFKLKFILLKIFLKRVSLKIITSTGRTGTKFFEELYPLLNKNAIVYHEPKPDLFDIGIEKIRTKGSKRNIQEYIIKNRGKLLFTKDNLIKFFFGIEIVYVESNPFLFPIIEDFTELFKDFQLIFITRDIKTYLISAYNKDPKGDGVNNFYCNSDLRNRLNAFDYNEMSLEEWNKLHRLEKIAWYWNKCNNELYNFQNKNFKFSLKIKFEELFSENEIIQSNTIIGLVEFLKCEKEFLINKNIILDVLKKKINKSKQLSDVNNFSNIEQKQKENIINLSSECAGKLNYNK